MKAFLHLFEQRIRGIRLIELVGIVLALAMIFWVCLSKAREGEDIRRMNDLDSQIAEQQEAVDALKIKVANLERPARLESLATQYLGMKPVDPAHEADMDTIGEISRTTSRAVAAPAVPAEANASASATDLISTAAASPEAHP